MLWWVASLIHAEYLTNMYGNEFYQTVNKECGIENGGYYTVLDYKHLKYGRLYCVIKNQYANYACELIITGSGQNQKIVSNDTIWSNTGSASEIIWPYWWHYIYGRL